MKNNIHFVILVCIALFPSLAWGSPFPECDFEPVPPTKPDHANYSRYVSLDTDLVVRFGGNFSAMFNLNSSNSPRMAQNNDSLYQYIGANGNLKMSLCGAVCFGIEQDIGMLYSGNRAHGKLYGSSYVLFGMRWRAGERSIFSLDVEGGAFYSLKNDKDIANKIFINTRVAATVKANADWTVYVVPDFGIGLHLDIGMALPKKENYLLLIDSGLHLTVKY